ncbi:hypothetical protein [Bradyrhizobium sp. STM 3557]|uniref:hypothetical protein n=1 Tax=Bradyrhizobium sp. STM 3557 TaxID=578920 RepID=UPI00388D8C21
MRDDIYRRFSLLWIALLYFFVHGALFIFDIYHPLAFLNGDRGNDRIVQVQEFTTRSSDYWALLLSPSPGDYAFHAILYRFGGQYLVIAGQVLIEFGILVGVYMSVSHLIGRRAAFWAGVLLVLMPGGLMSPHLLVTETWCTAFLSLGVLFLCLAIEDDGDRWSAGSVAFILAGFVSLALASFVRPQGLLLPLAGGLTILATINRGQSSVVLGIVASYLLFPTSLLAFHFVSNGSFALGASDADLGTNLLLRANRILNNPFLTPGEKLTIPQFLHIAAGHPVATVKTLYADAVNLFLNPGSNHLFGRYLTVYDPEDFTFWVGLLDKTGPVGVVSRIIRQGGLFLLTFAFWAALHATVLFGVTLALWRAFRCRPAMPPWFWIIVAVAGVYLVTAFAAGQLRWSHRAGIEPLLVILSVWGLHTPLRKSESEPARPVTAAV